MSEEQKTFEIKEEVKIGIVEPFLTNTLYELVDNCSRMPGEYCYKNHVVKQIADIAISANAEIRRLQGEGRLHQAEINHFQNLRSEHCREVTKLKKQLADAPTWGEWVDATIENLSEAEPGIYEFEATDGSTVIFNNEDNKMTNWCWFNRKSENTHGVMADDYTRFRRLNYTLKPAQEVEKDYFGNTAAEWLESEGEDEVIGALAKDLIEKTAECAAAQAKLRELKNK